MIVTKEQEYTTNPMRGDGGTYIEGHRDKEQEYTTNPMRHRGIHDRDNHESVGRDQWAAFDRFSMIGSIYSLFIFILSTAIILQTITWNKTNGTRDGGVSHGCILYLSWAYVVRSLKLPCDAVEMVGRNVW
jgi:hypothetical protein